METELAAATVKLAILENSEVGIVSAPFDRMNSYYNKEIRSQSVKEQLPQSEPPSQHPFLKTLDVRPQEKKHKCTITIHGQPHYNAACSIPSQVNERQCNHHQGQAIFLQLRPQMKIEFRTLAALFSNKQITAQLVQQQHSASIPP